MNPIRLRGLGLRDRFMLFIAINPVTSLLRICEGTDDDKFIRKVLNTNPTKTNSEVSLTTENYWLGQSFETHIK